MFLLAFASKAARKHRFALCFRSPRDALSPAETDWCFLQPVLPLALTPLGSPLPRSPTPALAFRTGF